MILVRRRIKMMTNVIPNLATTCQSASVAIARTVTHVNSFIWIVGVAWTTGATGVVPTVHVPIRLVTFLVRANVKMKKIL
jgi:hypothetical protein